jgi:CHASE2 domain-containing sensor protein
VPSPRRLTTIAIPTASACVVLASPRLLIAGWALITVIMIILALLLLPAVWSRKKCRRDSAYRLIKLIFESILLQGRRHV